MGDFRSDLGEQIMDLVDNALNSDNYDKLSETISRQMNKLLGGDQKQNPYRGYYDRYRQNGYGGYMGGQAGPGNTPYGRNGQNMQGNAPYGQNPQGNPYAGQYRQGGAAGQGRPGGAAYQGPYNGPGQTAYQNRQNNAYTASNAGRAAYDARRRNMMAGQPHTQYGAGAVNTGAQRTAAAAAAKQNTDLYFNKPQGDTAGVLMMIIGGIIGVNNGLRLIRTIAALFAGGGVAAVVYAALWFIIGAGVALWGLGLNNRVSRFKKYKKILKSKMYASVKELASETGKDEDFVRRDLKRMITQKWFKQGHLDDKETTMIATDALYNQYRETQAHADALRKEQEALEKEYGELSTDVKDVIKKGNEYTEKIREVNEALPEPEITEKLTRLEQIISKIFARLREEPGEAKNLSQFMDYYLPTTWKLVSAYREMAEQPVQGENIQNAKREIEESLDTINDAFETLLDSMFKEQAWDVSTDISVMKSMMKQDGLTGSDFQKKEVHKPVKAQGNAAVMEEK